MGPCNGQVECVCTEMLAHTQAGTFPSIHLPPNPVVKGFLVRVVPVSPTTRMFKIHSVIAWL